MKASKVRQAFLILFIIAYSTSVVMSILAKQWLFMLSLLGCGASVGAGEGLSVWLTGATLSTNMTRAWKEREPKAIFISVMCISLILTMVALSLHFFPWEWLGFQ